MTGHNMNSEPNNVDDNNEVNGYDGSCKEKKEKS